MYFLSQFAFLYNCLRLRQCPDLHELDFEENEGSNQSFVVNSMKQTRAQDEGEFFPHDFISK